jgi:hypothetical protein
MKKYKIRFLKLRDGQHYYERSVSFDSLELLFIISQDVEIIVRPKKKTGKIVLTFTAGALCTFVSANKLPLYILKKFLSEKEWKNDLENKKVK